MDVIPAKLVPVRFKPGAGIQKGAGFRVKHGMTNCLKLTAGD